MSRQFIAGAATVDIMAGNQIIATATTLLDSSISVNSSAEDVRGGLGAKLLGKYFHTTTFDINLTDVLFKLEYLAFQTGSTIQQIADIFTDEQVTLKTGGTGTVLGTPVKYNEYGVIGWVSKAGEFSYSTVTFTGKNFTVPGAKEGDIYCVKYLSTNNASRKITVSSTFIPSEVQLVMTANLYKAGSSDKVNASSKAGIIQVIVPRFLFNGAQEISMTSTGVSNTPLSGSALDNPAADCSEGGYYAIITETLTNANWYDDVFVLAIEDSDITLTTGGTQALSVYAIPKGNTAPFIPPYKDLTFTSKVGATATVDTSGVIAAKATGTTNVEVAITAKPTVVGVATVTVS